MDFHWIHCYKKSSYTPNLGGDRLKKLCLGPIPSDSLYSKIIITSYTLPRGSLTWIFPPFQVEEIPLPCRPGWKKGFISKRKGHTLCPDWTCDFTWGCQTVWQGTCHEGQEGSSNTVPPQSDAALLPISFPERGFRLSQNLHFFQAHLLWSWYLDLCQSWAWAAFPNQ